MAKTTLLGFSMEGLPTVMENAEKMAKARVRIIDAKHNMIADIKARRAIAGKTESVPMKNVTPIETDGAIDVSFKAIEAKKEVGTKEVGTCRKED